MNEATDKRVWEIDRILQGCVGAQIRVGTEAFAPLGESQQVPARLIQAKRLILPDNTAVEGHPVFFEGSSCTRVGEWLGVASQAQVLPPSRSSRASVKSRH